MLQHRLTGQVKADDSMRHTVAWMSLRTPANAEEPQYLWIEEVRAAKADILCTKSSLA